MGLRIALALALFAVVGVTTTLVLVAVRGSSGASALARTKRGVFVVHSSSGSGTGFLVEHGGKLYGVTAFHVVAADDRVVLEREAGEVGSEYTIPIYADIAYVAPRSDLAILRFDQNLPRELVGAPLRLATPAELKRAVDEVRVWGGKEDIAHSGNMTTLHSEKSMLTSHVTNVSPVDVFTKQVTTEYLPEGFTISPGIYPGFSGGPAITTVGGNDVVIGVAITLSFKETTGQSGSAIVATTELTKALDAAARVPRPDEIGDPNSTSGFNLHGACEKALNDVVHAALAAPPAEQDVLTALTIGRQIGGTRYNIYDRLSPTSRKLFFQSDLLTERMIYNVLLPIMANEQELRKVQGLVQLGVGLAKRISDRFDEVVPLYYDLQLHKKWQPKDPSPTATITLANGTHAPPRRVGKQAVTFRYDVTGAGFAAGTTAVFEFAQGNCGLIFDEDPATP